MENETPVTPASPDASQGGPAPVQAPTPTNNNLLLIIGIVVAVLIVSIVVGYFAWQVFYPPTATPAVIPAQTSVITPTPTPDYSNPFDTYENPFSE